jgi:hypothetical protein
LRLNGDYEGPVALGAFDFAAEAVSGAWNLAKQCEQRAMMVAIASAPFAMNLGLLNFV